MSRYVLTKRKRTARIIFVFQHNLFMGGQGKRGIAFLAMTITRKRCFSAISLLTTVLENANFSCSSKCKGDMYYNMFILGLLCVCVKRGMIFLDFRLDNCKEMNLIWNRSVSLQKVHAGIIYRLYILGVGNK